MAKSVQQIAIEFDRDDHSRPHDWDTFNEIHQQLTFYNKTHYCQYLPTVGAEHADFENRLHDWLCNHGLTEPQRKLLLRLAPRIIFLNREDFTQLQRSAFAGPITRWIVDELDMSFGDAALDEKIQRELHNHTWFTSITDSMRIADFHHANNLGGIDFRPDWRSLQQFGDPTKIKEFMAGHTRNGENRPIKRIVILEDFVGSGTQMSSQGGCVAFAASQFPDVSILLVPLVVCPEGASKSIQLASQFSNVRFEPILQLRREDLILGDTPSAVSDYEHELVQLANDIYTFVEGDGAGAPRPYHALGFSGHARNPTGAIVVMYSNTPANTLPLIHHESSAWNPLFPRSARIR